MTGFTPGRRWQPAYSPFQKETFGERALRVLEYSVKGPLFGCRMCGNCLLAETALICPMECPKGLRNGPCGGSTSEFCYVDKSRPCVWYKIYERSFAWGREDLLLEVLPPLDWEKVGKDSWGAIFKNAWNIGAKKIFTGLLSAETRAQTIDGIFRPVRQPAWWKGDSEYHPPAYIESASSLQGRLVAGDFVVTAEITPPISSSTDKLIRNIEMVKSLVTAINFTDNQGAMPRMSSWACSQVAMNQGAEPVLQMSARNRSRGSVQSEIIGATALGVRNVLCVTGDSAKMSPSPRGNMEINDLDSIQMLWVLRRMRDEGKYLDGREIKNPPMFFLGTAASPFSSNVKFQALREQKKVNAGAQFFQTNLIFDVNGMENWLNELAKRNILDKVYILAGVTPIKSLKMAQKLAEVPGVYLPKNVLHRIEVADRAGNAQEEGIQIALEIIGKIRGYEMQGIHGIHLMPVGWDEVIPRIVLEAGLIRRANASSGSAQAPLPQFMEVRSSGLGVPTV
ncbi:MAG TPA: methylenetetrahydrofolate reductase C-terminal domain-containing protein [Anaerolineales bacterium]|nr:methylenetetrahydrofolate reductase C-terminal domain-containing protein [Anaerolineales bacterium]HNS62607.1 methylenetetrahydrofolate reductase C-terminal domain-containing protein [Anaerolineales bacterium]